MLDRYIRILADAPTDRYFKTGFGDIRNLRELSEVLREKGPMVYEWYVNDKENHFANWVEHVFGDNDLAGYMRKARSSEKTVKLIQDRLNFASLYISYYTGKEILADFLLNSQLSKGFMSNGFEPSHHKFETLLDFIPEIPQKNPITNTKQPEAHKSPVAISFGERLETMKNQAQKVPLLENHRYYEYEYRKKDEKQILKDLETQFPGLKVTETKKQAGLLDSLMQLFKR